jgi:hypothetical protein
MVMLLPVAAFAQKPVVETSGRTEEAALVLQDADASVYRAFEQFTALTRREKYLIAGGEMVAGAALLGVGMGADIAQDPLRDAWLMSGGVLLGGGLLSALLPTGAETMAKEHGVGTIEHPTADQAAALEDHWRRVAEQAENWRIVAGISGSLLATGLLVGGTSLAVSDNSRAPELRTFFSTYLLSMGALSAVWAASSFVLPTRVSRFYELYRASRGSSSRDLGLRAPQLHVAVSGAPAGFGLGLRGTF